MVKLLSNLLLSTSKNSINVLKKSIKNNELPIDGYIITESLPLIKSEKMREYIFNDENMSKELLIYLTDKPERYKELLSLMNSPEVRKYNNMFEMLFNVIRKYGSHYDIIFHNDVKLIDVLEFYKESEYHINYNDYNNYMYNNQSNSKLYIDLFIDCEPEIIMEFIFGKNPNMRLVLEIIKNDCIKYDKIIDIHNKLSLRIQNLYININDDYTTFEKEPFVSKDNYEDYKKNIIRLLQKYICY